jgi:4-amino-4-deoxy-L-arabinose transferase-like glycosyltransferase
MMPRDAAVPPIPLPAIAPPGPGDRLRALLLDSRAHGALLTACAALVILARAGHGPLANYDDAYYAEKAKQMLRTGDWLTPRFAGLERLDNPPLFLWLMASSFAVLGINGFAAVLFSALAGIAGVAITHRLALRLGRGPFEAWAAALVLLATGYYLKYSNHAMFDVFLTSLFLGSLLAYRRAWEGGARAWLAVGVLTGLGVLTKSVLGLFPLVVIGAHVVWCGRLRRSLAAGAWLVPLAAAAVVSPWYGYQLVTHHDAFVGEHFTWLLLQRGFGTGHEASSPWSPFGYLRELALTYWPWLPFAAGGLWLTAREAFAAARSASGEWGPGESARLLLLWPLIVIAVLSAAHEQKLWYAMSALPALALLCAHALAAWVRSEATRERTVLAGFALAAVAGAVLALTPIGQAPPRRPDLQRIAHAARTLVRPEERIVLAGSSYFSIAHQFVFYSDRSLVAGVDDADSVRAWLDAGGWALVSSERYSGFFGPDSLRYPPVVASGKWRLVHAAPAPRVTLEPTDAFE